MDNIRSSDPFGSGLETEAMDSSDYVTYDENEDVAMDAPPSIQGDERRLQVRAYNFWTEQLGDNNYPSVEDLDPENSEDFAPFGVLLDFTSGIENPSIAYVGEALRDECGLSEDVSYLDQVPARSLLSRITDHYLQIIANRAPIGFEAEFVNEAGITIMYRGILLPYSSDNDTIDFIYGLINWKEGADKSLTDELELEVSNALQDPPAKMDTKQIWADGPNSKIIDAGSDVDEISLEGFEEPNDDDSLADWLHAARYVADSAKTADARSRETLYNAISRAYDFALVADDNPEDYQMILQDCGLKSQERAPMTPIVKLIFGINYDKTRITEIASAMSFAKRSDIAIGGLSTMLSSYDGGLKGMVKAERLAKKIESGVIDTNAIIDPREALRNAPSRSIDAYTGEGDEFVVLMARRDENGELSIIGHVETDKAMTEKALRKTIL